MRSMMFVACVVVALGAGNASAVPSLEDQKLAVLEFLSTEDARLRAPEVLTDACRGAVVERTKALRTLVLTRENMVEVVKASGGKCAEGECDVETARNLGVPYFITGFIARIDTTWVLTLKAYETRSGGLLAQRLEQGSGELALLEKVRPATFAVLTQAFGIGATPATPPASFREGRFEDKTQDFGADIVANVVVNFESEPAGATVRLDGALLCQATPCHKRVEAGAHEVVFEKERYAATSFSVTAKKGAIVRGTLAPLFGVLIVETEPPGVLVRVNGTERAASPLRLEMDAGPVEVVVDDGCRVRTGERLTIKAGEERRLRLTPKPRLAGLKATAQDGSGNDVEGEVVVDGIVVGEIGSTLSVPLCSNEISIQTPTGGWASALSLTEGNVTHLTAVLSRGLPATTRDGASRTEPNTGLTWVRMPTGSFHYGCEPQDTQCDEDEKPGRTERVEGFWLMQTEVTVDAYRACERAGACSRRACASGTALGADRDPAVCADHAQAKKFCAWVGGRLPSALEWEYAAKSGRSRVYPWGDAAPDGSQANCSGYADHFDLLAPAGSFPKGASEWGLLDMAGNAGEWTATTHSDGNIEARGGSWFDGTSNLRASDHVEVAPDSHLGGLGWRCAQ